MHKNAVILAVTSEREMTITWWAKNVRIFKFMKQMQACIRFVLFK